MNMQLTDPVKVSIDMPRHDDEEVAGDIEEESVFTQHGFAPERWLGEVCEKIFD